LPPASVQVNPGAGKAVYQVSNLAVEDFTTLDNAFNGGPGVPATVSFEVRWSGVDERVNLKDEDARFGGEFVRGRTQMRWSAAVGPYVFESGGIETSFSDFATLGTERNGVFFPRS
jgi:hypothetical protein